MAEAGRFADTVEGLRLDGFQVDAVLAAFGNGNADELASWAADAEDPNRNFVVTRTDEDALFDAFAFDVDNGHPLRCVVGPDRTIEWCDQGHGLAGPEPPFRSRSR